MSRDVVMPADNPEFRAVPHAASPHIFYFVGDEKREKKLCSQTFTGDPWREKSRPPNAQFAFGENIKRCEIANESRS